MTQPRWARELRRRKAPRLRASPTTATDTIVALHDVAKRGNRLSLSPSAKDLLVHLLVDSTPPHQEDPRTQGFIRRTAFFLKKGRNLFPDQARTALLTIHDWHNDEEVADLATGALEDLYPDPETWYR